MQGSQTPTQRSLCWIIAKFGLDFSQQGCWCYRRKMAFRDIFRVLLIVFTLQGGFVLYFCFMDPSCGGAYTDDSHRVMFEAPDEGIKSTIAWNIRNATSNNYKNYHHHNNYKNHNHSYPDHKSSRVRVPILDNKTAVVVTMSHLNECEAVRLRHLIDTSGLDVWLLHGHDTLRRKFPKAIATSEKIATSIEGLHLWPQARVPLVNFDSKISGATKSSFLKFLIAHSQYKYAWHIESDVFYTGEWKNVLVHRDPKADFLCTKSFEQESESWWKKLGNGTCLVDGERCFDISKKQSYWMASRVSRRLALALMSSLQKGQVTGHHEALIAAFCQKRGFKLQKLKWAMIGQAFHAGNTVPYSDRGKEKRSSTLARDGPVFPAKLYHPVKCVAYSSPAVMQAEIDQWLPRKDGAVASE